MLESAAAADAEVRARRAHPVGAGLQHVLDDAAIAVEDGAYVLAGQAAGHEDLADRAAREPIASGADGFDLEDDRFAERR
jgi:hypothetical protein